MSDQNKVMVKAIRTFEGDEGFKNAESAPFAVTSQRLADLKANHLVEEVGEKAAAKHEDKSAPTPANKAAAKPTNK